MIKEGIDFLSVLQTEIWITQYDYGFRRNLMFEKRVMTHDEWDRLVSILSGSREVDSGLYVVCNPVNACMGFGFGLDVYLCTDELYPGVGVQKDGVLGVTQKHIPLFLADNPKRGVTFSDGWKILSVFTHGEENAALIRRFGFEPLQSESHYDY